MTTIVYDGERIAADRMVIHGDGIKIQYSKIKTGTLTRTYHGIATNESVYLASTGYLMSALVMEKWILESGNPSDFPKLEDGCATIVIYITDPKTAYIYFNSGPHPMLVTTFPTAIGSGANYALCAMEVGASIEKAVEIAAKFDDNTGFGVEVFKIQP